MWNDWNEEGPEDWKEEDVDEGSEKKVPYDKLPEDCGDYCCGLHCRTIAGCRDCKRCTE